VKHKKPETFLGYRNGSQASGCLNFWGGSKSGRRWAGREGKTGAAGMRDSAQVPDSRNLLQKGAKAPRTRAADLSRLFFYRVDIIRERLVPSRENELRISQLRYRAGEFLTDAAQPGERFAAG
jgi:hypothetical protein